MDLSHKTSVMVIENDDDFRELLNGIFERSELFDLVGSYGSIEEFGIALLQQKPLASWIPDLMVVDVMSSDDPRTESASFMSALRSEGLSFATVFVSSMEFGALIRVLHKSHPVGWAALQKNSRLTEQNIIESAVAVCSEMKSK
jgi:hypothetical protein